MALSLRSIHDIAQAYGYTVDDDRERQFVMMTLSAVSANGIAEKQKALTALHTVGKGLNQGMTWKAIDALLANALAQPVIEQLGVKNLAKKLGLNITKRKAAQIVPVVGAAVGGGVNALMLRDITSTARMVYRRRWLDDRAKPVIDVAAAD